MPTMEAKIVSVQKDTSRDPAWYRIGTDHGTVKRLDTQRDDLAKEAWDLMQAGQAVVIEFTSKPRTLEDGRTFQNYYYEHARTAAVNGGAAAGIPEVEQPARTPAGETPDRSWRIALQCGAKLAVASVPQLKADGYETSLTALQQVALVWGTWLFFTPVPTTSTRPAEPQPAFAGEPSDPSFMDDDIPF